MRPRVPVPPLQLSHGQAEVILIFLIGVAVLVTAWFLLEIAFGRTAEVALRLTGHQKPRKSPTRIAIDQLEARIKK